jgi:hypothetical protein
MWNSPYNMSLRQRGGVEVYLYRPPISAVDGVGGKRYTPAALFPGKAPVTIARV